MRIAVFTGTFPAISETFILRQITGLIDAGHEVDIYAETRPRVEEQVHPDVTAYGLVGRTRYVTIPPESGYWEMPVWPPTGKTWLPGADRPISNLGRLLRAAPVLARCALRAPPLSVRALRTSEYGYQASSLSALYRLHDLSSAVGRHRYDVLHAHFGPVASSFRFARQLWKAPLVASFHGYDFSSWPRRHGRKVYTRLFRTADIVTVGSSHAYSRLKALGCSPEKLRKLPVGLDLRNFPYNEHIHNSGDSVRVLTVGRLVEKKGIEYSIRAVARVFEDFPGLRYDIVGDGPLRSRLEALVRELGAEEKIRFHGARDQDYVRRAMEEAHLFLLSSVTASDGDQEGQGLVLQEAQAAGLPIVATQHNGFAESILPGVSGFLVPERDVDTLTDRIRFLLQHPEIWAQMGRAGRRYVQENFEIRDLNRRLTCLYQEAIERYRKGTPGA